MSGMLDFFTEGTVTGELVTELQGVVENIDPEPSATKDLKIYTAEGIPGRTIALDVVGSTLQVVQTSPRGTDAPKAGGTDRDIVDFRAVRVALEKDFDADAALDIRKVGTAGTHEEFSSYAPSSPRGRQWHRPRASCGLPTSVGGRRLSDPFPAMPLGRAGIHSQPPTSCLCQHTA